MKEIFLENWKIISALVLIIITCAINLITIIKKSGGKVSVWDALKSVILEQIPSYIAIVEQAGNGEEKKNKVLNLALKEASKKLGRNLTEDETSAIVALVSQQVELVLATPQKKTASESKPKSKYRAD